jgi:hypothetical protein
MRAQQPNSARQVIVARNDHTAFAASDVFIAEQAETASFADSP